MLDCRRATLIYNPAARKLQRGCGEKLRKIKDALTSFGVQAEFLPTERSLHAAELSRKAVESGTELIIVCGGDGTVNEVIAGMAGSAVPLLVLPAGTANVLAKDLRLDKGLTAPLRLLQKGAVRRIALGMANGRPFALMAGIGVDAGVVAAVHPALKKKAGQGAFWLAGFRQLFQYSFPELELTSGGNTYRATFAVIARSHSYGGPLSLVPQADLFADRFDVCLFEGRSRWVYLRYLVFALFRRHLHLSGVRHFAASSVDVQGDPGLWIQVDGELLGHVPARFTILPDALSLVVPADR